MHWVPGALHHIAFTLPDEQAGAALYARLAAHGVASTPILTTATMRNILFQDNNGMLLEADWSPSESVESQGL